MNWPPLPQPSHSSATGRPLEPGELVIGLLLLLAVLAYEWWVLETGRWFIADLRRLFKKKAEEPKP